MWCCSQYLVASLFYSKDFLNKPLYSVLDVIRMLLTNECSVNPPSDMKALTRSEDSFHISTLIMGSLGWFVLITFEDLTVFVKNIAQSPLWPANVIWHIPLMTHFCWYPHPCAIPPFNDSGIGSVTFGRWHISKGNARRSWIGACALGPNCLGTQLPIGEMTWRRTKAP